MMKVLVVKFISIRNALVMMLLFKKMRPRQLPTPRLERKRPSPLKQST